MTRREDENAIPRSDLTIAYEERKKITMIAKLIAPLFISGAAAAGIALAPIASASPADCEQSGQTSVCQRPGHTSIYSSPNTTVDTGISWPLGAGPVPPIWAMD